MDFDTDEFVAERTLCQLPSCHVFQIPRLATAGGHRAADWPKDPVWTGKVKITARGQKATIFLLDANTNASFATCHVDEGSVERVTDSGRYFVLKITNAQGKHAFIGIAFNERNDAFDFNVSLQEHKNECDRENQAAKGDLVVPEASNAFRLKEGEKIKVKIAGGKAGGRSAPRAGGGSGGGGGFLAPPKEKHHGGGGGGGLLSPPPATTTATSNSNNNNTSSVFGFDSSFGSALPSSSSSASATGAPPAPSSDPFGSFSDPFGGSSAISTSSSDGNDPFGSSFENVGTTAPASVSNSNSSDPFSNFGASSSSQPAASSGPNLLDF